MAKGFRAQLLEDLVKINDWQRYIVGFWRSTSVLDPGALHYRRARPDELPENSVEELRRVERYMSAVITRAEQIRAYTVARIAELEGKTPR